MWPPLLRVLLDEPELISGYASAYAVLLRQDAAGWRARQMRRLGYLLAVASGVLLALLFTGIALMLYAVTGGEHWLLWGVPAVPLTWAFAASWLLWRAPPTPSPFPRVREQVAQDMALFGLKGSE
ncbi:MAG: hypothetical protein Q7T90_11820 [Thiobacillus sp.]|nr:hypothetical protein [Thiobacillus sp.]